MIKWETGDEGDNGDHGDNGVNGDHVDCGEHGAQSQELSGLFFFAHRACKVYT